MYNQQVKFQQRADADKCILRASDASVAALGPIECDGRPLRVAIAVDRKEAAGAVCWFYLILLSGG